MRKMKNTWYGRLLMSVGVIFLFWLWLVIVALFAQADMILASALFFCGPIIGAVIVDGVLDYIKWIKTGK